MFEIASATERARNRRASFILLAERRHRRFGWWDRRQAGNEG
jgi:hypothetical protein